MTREIIMPQQGLTMEEGTFLGFLAEPGTRVEVGEEFFEIETDKSAITVEATEAGYLREIVAERGQLYPVGTVLGFLTDTADEPLER